VAVLQELGQLCASRALSSDQRQVVSLLNRLHAVHLDNAELQSQLVLRQLDVRRRDLLIDWQRRHDDVARTLITRQQVLISDSSIYRPADLQQLHDVYDKETHEIASYRHSSFLPAIPTNTVSSVFQIILVAVSASFSTVGTVLVLVLVLVPVQSFIYVSVFV